jgi:hypothetical protein
MKNTLFLLLLILLIACQPKNEKSVSEAPTDLDLNFPAEGFDIEGSDPIAIIIADRVMTAMGGKKAWNETRYISWNFFGSRKLLWDKQEGMVRIENQKDDKVILLNLTDMTGKVFKGGAELSNPDSLNFYLAQGNRIWINDSYWLVMPFKLKDSGVTLSYEKQDTTMTGAYCDVLRLTFSGVGVTPDNSYLVWVSSESDLVEQWAYYRDFSDEEPRWIRPWGNYQQMGNILLGDDRGDRDLSEVQVLAEVPAEIFTSFDVSL